MAPEQKKGEGKYNFLADIYSLGIMFFEMWATFSTLIEMDKAFTKLKQEGEIAQEYTKKMPEQAKALILWMCKDRPQDRPTTVMLLQR